MSRERRLSILVALCSILLTIAAIEFVMRHTIRMSASQTSVMGKDWLADHWTPINTLGYRDVEPHSADLTNVLVVGDSYMAGYGIDAIEDRFSSVLQRALGDSYGVNIAAVSGWETPRQFEALQAYPVEPDVVVWSYVANDITWVVPDYPAIYSYDMLHRFTDRFYVTTFLYARLAPPTDVNLASDLYLDPQALARQTTLLQQVIDYCAGLSIPMVFVVWDTPTRTDSVHHITAFLDSNGARYVDMSAILDGRPLSEIAASPLDAHPNAAVHAEAAGYVAPLITASETVDARR